jgi:hypothetical protein
MRFKGKLKLLAFKIRINAETTCTIPKNLSKMLDINKFFIYFYLLNLYPLKN